MHALETSDQKPIIEFLSAPGAYGAGVRRVERFETHGSVVFLAGDRAYKLKRAVRYPYMDYSTVERRHEMCLRELEMNYRTAPMLYLAVRPILRDPGGVLRFGTETEGSSAIDWVLVMRRFGQAALLEQMRRSGGLSPAMMRLLAEVIAEFHSKAEIVGEFSGAAGIRNAIENNSAILRESIDRPFERKLVEQYCDESLLFHARISALLEQRREQGCVRRCHGDLHLNNIFMFEGRPTLFDGIEFNDAFSCIDVLYDLAFLLMDLDRHRLRNLANTILNRYLELSPQHTGLAALPLFISCRAAIRAHTAVAAAEAISGGAPATTLVMDAAALLRHAVDALSMPRARLIAVGGISGTGKSTLARDLAPGLGPVPGAIVIRSDIIRKQLMRVPETVRLPQEAYASAVTERVYRRIEELAHTCLMAGYPVIADAVYGTEVERQGIAQIAKTLDVSFAGLWLHAPTDVLEARLGKRQGDASDATIKVMHDQLKFVEAPVGWSRISASSSASDTLAVASQSIGVPPS